MCTNARIHVSAGVCMRVRARAHLLMTILSLGKKLTWSTYCVNYPSSTIDERVYLCVHACTHKYAYKVVLHADDTTCFVRKIFRQHPRILVTKTMLFFTSTQQRLSKLEEDLKIKLEGKVWDMSVALNIWGFWLDRVLNWLLETPRGLRQ